MKNLFSTVFGGVGSVMLDNSDGNARSRRNCLYYYWLAAIITPITTGTYFTGLMLHFGADELYISIIASLTSLCGLASLFSPILLEKIERRKPLLITLRAVYHIVFIGILVIVPTLPISKPAVLTLFFISVLIANLINSISSSGLSVWHIQNVPDEKYSNYFTLIHMGTQLIGCTIAIFAGMIVDHYTAAAASGEASSYTAFVILRAFALVVGAVEIYTMTKIRETPYKHKDNEKLNLRLLLLPLRSKRYLKICLIYFLHVLAANLLGQYYSVYMLDICKIDYTFISLCDFLSLPIMLISMPLWSKLVNHFTWKKVLPINVLGVGICWIFCMFVTSATPYFYLFTTIVYKIFYPSAAAIFAYMPYKYMPEENKTAYFSFYSSVALVFAFLGNLVGMLFMTLTSGATLNLFGTTFLNYQYITAFQVFVYICVTVYAIWALKDKN